MATRKRIHEIPLADRPREKLQRKGVVALSDFELLQVVIGSGTKGARSCSQIVPFGFCPCSPLDDYRRAAELTALALGNLQDATIVYGVILNLAFVISSTRGSVCCMKCSIPSRFGNQAIWPTKISV